MKLCISNTANRDVYLIGESFPNFAVITQWLRPFLNARSGYHDLCLEPDQLGLFNESVKRDVLNFLQSYQDTRVGVLVRLLGKEVRVPPKKTILSYAKFIGGLYNSTDDVIKRRGFMFFDFYDYNVLVDIFFRCLETGVFVYRKFEVLAAFSGIYNTTATSGLDSEGGFENAIVSLVRDGIINLYDDNICLTDKGKRILRVLTGSTTP